MTTTPTLWKDLGKINTGDVGPTGDFQFDPVVTGLANGNFLIAYTDDSNSVGSANGTDIMGRLYDPEGNPLTASFQLNSFAAIDDEGDPEVAALSDGGFVLVYEDWDANGTRLIWQTHNALGQITDQGVLQADPGVETVADPRVAVFSDDSFVVVYTHSLNVGANTDVVARIVESDGTVGAEFTIRSHPDDPRQPTVTVLENDSFVVAYVEDDPAGAKLEYALYKSDGSLLKAASNITSPGSENEDPQVVALKGGGFVIAWSDETAFADENIYARVYNSAGTDISGLIDVATDGDDDAEPTVAALDDGGFVVLYDDDSNEAIRGQRFDSLGVAVGSVFTMEQSGQLVNTPEVAALSDGRFVGTWQLFDTVGNDFDVKAEIWDPRDPTIFGTTVEDVLTGRQGTSSIFGLRGDDTIFGVLGNDKIDAGSGQDTVYGGSGSDTVFDTDQLSFDTFYGGSGQDWIDFSGDTFGPFVAIDLQAGIATFTGGNSDLIIGFEHAVASRSAQLLGTSGFNSLVGTNSGGNVIDGRGGDDRLFGVGGNNTMFGGDGNDSLVGGNDTDSLMGRSGLDRLFGNDGNDSIFGDSGIDFGFGWSGQDALYGGDSNDTLAGGTGHDYLQGDSGNDRLYGNDDDDVLKGGSGLDLLQGGTGDDSLNGEAGGDTLFGGLGNNTLFGANGDDRLFGAGSGDAIFGGGGKDLAIASNTDDSIFGGDGDDTLYANNGNDRLGGGSGRDSLFGGSGNDTLEVSSGHQEVGEILDGGAGDDTVLFLSGTEGLDDKNYVSIEAARFFGSQDDDLIHGLDSVSRNVIFGFGGDDDLRGTSSQDSLYGATDNDSLRGEEGDDRVTGGMGNDVLFGGAGIDDLYGGSGRDRMAGGTGSDTLFGGSASDRLNGASGSDNAFGGKNNDTFIVDTVGDLVFETAGGGIEDVIRSDASAYTLITGNFGHVERVNLNTAAGSAMLVGNQHDNTLIGNSLANTLIGNSGNDILNASNGGTNRMTGGSGDDTFVVATADDVVQEFSGGGTDLVRALSDYTLPGGSAGAFVENLRLQGGFGNLNGTGNTLDNTITGNSGDNRLSGNQGVDTLDGGDGDDTLFGGALGDRMNGESGNDTLRVGKDDAAFGGSGSDSFVFASSNLTSGSQVIRDFDGVSLNAANAEDKIVMATGLETGSFDYVGAAAFSGAGNSEARFAGSLTLEIDQDGDGAADLSFRVNGLTAANQLTASDFVWL